jgi:glyoxylase-like metal-dependent hydrolase (beta-lactamase superfamily II)
MIQVVTMEKGSISIKTYTASDAGFAVNSHLILGEKEAILVDAQFTRSEARKVADMIRESRRELKAIFITHGHPDHYLGLEILKKEFPEAKVLATKGVADYIQKTGSDYIAKWKPAYGNDLADSFVIPQATEAHYLDLDGEQIRIMELGPGESESAAALYIPTLKTLISGDAVYNEVHLWLAENRPDGWLANLDKLSNLGEIDKVLPGHGSPAGPKVLSEDKSYIQNFVKAILSSRAKEEALEKIKAQYPGYRLPVIAEISIGTVKQK